jgi:hypothetical protein
VDVILFAATQGGALFCSDNGRNLLRSVTLPRGHTIIIFSRDFQTSYPRDVNVKYPDVYLQFTFDTLILDDAPFISLEAGKSNTGIGT